MRIDLLLVERGYFESRNKAKAAIDSGNVKADGVVVKKASMDVSSDSVIEILDGVCPYVSRGGYKLEAAIKEFLLDFNGKTIVDIGASTGGFTDCALQFGASRVYSIDVGQNQLAEKLLLDSRVVSLEQTNILDIDYFPEPIDYFVMDVSFVSITHLLDALDKYIDEKNALVCLIKPQFEVGKVYMKNGIVKDSAVHINVLENVSRALNEKGLYITKLIPSPILGGSGNREFLALVKRNSKTNINFIDVCRR